MEDSDQFISRNLQPLLPLQRSSLDQIDEDDEKSQNFSQNLRYSRESSTSSSGPSCENTQRNSKGAKHRDTSEVHSYIDDPSFYCQDLSELDHTKLIKDNKHQQNLEYVYFENPNPDFEVWDFHPNELEVPSTFTYSTHLENLRLSLNTYLKKPIKMPFSVNAKKAVVTINKHEHQTIDTQLAQMPKMEFSILLNQEYQSLTSGKHITKRKNLFLQQAQLIPFFRSKRFRKMTNLYYYVDPYGQGLTLSNVKARNKRSRKHNNNNNGVSPRKSLLRVIKKRSTILLKQHQTSTLEIPQVENVVASPIIKQQPLILENPSQQTPIMLSKQNSPPEHKTITHKLSHSQKPPVNTEKIMTRRISGGARNISPPDTLEQQIARYRFSEKKYETKPRPPYAQYMHISKRASTDTPQQPEKPSLSKQFPMIRFENPTLTLKVENYSTSKDQKILDMLTTLYAKNSQNIQIDKNQLGAQYYSKRISDMSTSNKQSLNDRTGQERKSMMQSRASHKDLKEELTFTNNNKTYTNFSTVLKKEKQSEKSAMSLPYISNASQSATKETVLPAQQRQESFKFAPSPLDPNPSSYMQQRTTRKNHFLSKQ